MADPFLLDGDGGFLLDANGKRLTTSPWVTYLGPGGYSQPPWGNFEHKNDAKSFVQNFTVLGPGGYARPPYASFAGKGRLYSQPFTVLGPGGYPRAPYASFANKLPSTGASYFGQRGKIMRTLSQGIQ